MLSPPERLGVPPSFLLRRATQKRTNCLRCCSHPDIGLRLANMAADAGLTPDSLCDMSLSIDKRRSRAERMELAAFFRSLFSSCADALIAKGRTTRACVAEMEADFDRLAADDDAIMLYTAFQLHAVKPMPA